MIIFGIDPGVSGAICALKDKKIIEVYEMPTMIDGKKKQKTSKWSRGGQYISQGIK